jgi:uncharacterized membrane protein YjgN (DUF898 family)
MSDIQSASEGVTPRGEYPFAFCGTGGEYFRIWIVNLALTILTLGIYSAWAKVRTRRYFYGNTYVAGHAFDYHASPIRILIGRAIALALFIGYSLSASASPTILGAWLIAFVILVPWLVNAALRFNARNSSYRNIRFNFTGTYFGALKAFILWPLFGFVSLFLAWPLAHRARNYFYVNHHIYAGKPFSCSYPGWEIYKVYIASWLLLVATTTVLSVLIYSLTDIEQLMSSVEAMEQDPEDVPTGLFGILAALYAILLIAFLAVGTFIRTMTFNLAVDNTQIDNRHWLDAKLNPFVMIWIVASNLFLIFLTLGIFYPWARVRVARYTANKMTLFGREGLDAYMAQLSSEQSAIGEEVASFFDIDIGL